MSSRRQRTKQFNNFTFEIIDQLFEISKTQSIVKILIRLNFESESSSFQFITDFKTDVQNTVFFQNNIDINMNLFDNVVDQNDFIEQMKLKLTIIKIEKKCVHLRHKLIQIKTKKKIDFFVIVFEISKSFRENVEF